MINWIKSLFRKSYPPVRENVTIPTSSDYGYISIVEHKEHLADLNISRRKDWVIASLMCIAELPASSTVTGEEIREFLLENGVEPPHHQNVWGALIRIAIARGYLEPTGDVRPMKSPQAHGRRTPVYRVL